MRHRLNGDDVITDKQPLLIERSIGFGKPHTSLAAAQPPPCRVRRATSLRASSTL